MKELDDVEIYCPQQPINFAKSVSFPINTKQSQHLHLHSDDSCDQQKSGQLKPMLFCKPTKSRKKVSILKAPKQPFQKHSEHRSSEFTKRKPSTKKKMSSVSEDKGPTIDYSEQVIQLLKKQLKEKEKEVKYYRTHLEKLEEITDVIAGKNFRSSFESTLSLLRNKVQTEICKAFPTVARLIDTMLTVLEDSAVTVNTTLAATQKHSTWSNMLTEPQNSVDPGCYILKDIEELEEKLNKLKEQSIKLRASRSNVEDMAKLKKMAQEQQQQILKLIEMEEEMDSHEKQFKKKGISGPMLKLSK